MSTDAHLHLLVRGYIKTPPKNEKLLNIWFKQLALEIGMKHVTPPISNYIEDTGMAGTALFDTADTSIHIWDNTPTSLIQFDLYSYTKLKPKKVLAHINAWFELDSVYWQLIDRSNDGFKVMDSGDSVKI